MEVPPVPVLAEVWALASAPTGVIPRAVTIMLEVFSAFEVSLELAGPNKIRCSY